MDNKRVEIIAGRPSSGKTLLASQICREGINEKKSVLYFSLELPASYLAQTFGLPAQVEIIDDPETDWPGILQHIKRFRPAITIIDYIQLLGGHSEQTIDKIIEDHSNFSFDLKIVILSQLSCSTDQLGTMPTHLDLHKAKITSVLNRTLFTALKKSTYMLKNRAA